MTRRHFATLSTLSIAALLPACLSVGPDYAGVGDGAAADGWSASVSRHLQGSKPELEQWWKGFKDPVLNELIDRTRKGNKNLKIASQRIYEARAQRGIAQSQMLPSVGAGGDYARIRASESLFLPPPANPYDQYTAGFDAGWEIDIFGGIRRNIEASDANLDASAESYRDTLVTLLAETAINYIEYRTLQRRIGVAKQNIGAQEETTKLAQDRFDNELVPRIDVTQSTTNLELTRSVVPALETQLAFAKNRLATLTGGVPASVEKLLARPRGIPVPRSGYSAGLPADLLRSRPDIRQAERQLAAQTALIGVAAADLYPRFTLFGNFSLQSVDSSTFWDSASRGYSFGPAFSWQIFSGGRIRNSIKAQESVTEQALLNYENTVLRAVEEVESSMVAIANERRRNGHLDKAVDNAGQTVGMVRDSYREGLVDFQRVLDAERTKFDAEDDQALSVGQVAKNYVTLYKALGGGTEVEVIPVENPSINSSGLLRRKNTIPRSEPAPVPPSAANTTAE